MSNSKPRIKTKYQLTIIVIVVTVLLACYTMGALWEYADTLNAQNGWMLKIGFAACEFMVGVWGVYHIWRRWVWTRVVCLALAISMSIFLVVHSSALTKYVAAKKEASGQTTGLSEGIAKVTQATTAGIMSAAGDVAQRQRLSGAPNTARGTVSTATKQAAEIGTKNAQILADTSLKLEEQAKNSTFLSAEYMNGKMQAVVFVYLLLGVGLMFAMFELGKAEEDDDNDGIPNFADLDSSYYDPSRALTWWHARGQYAPHELAPREPQPQTQQQPIPLRAPAHAQTGPTEQPRRQFRTGFDAPAQPPAQQPEQDAAPAGESRLRQYRRWAQGAWGNRPK